MGGADDQLVQLADSGAGELLDEQLRVRQVLTDSPFALLVGMMLDRQSF